jgi:hypothetical protein
VLEDGEKTTEFFDDRFDILGRVLYAFNIAVTSRDYRASELDDSDYARCESLRLINGALNRSERVDLPVTLRGSIV